MMPSSSSQQPRRAHRPLQKPKPSMGDPEPNPYQQHQFSSRNVVQPHPMYFGGEPTSQKRHSAARGSYRPAPLVGEPPHQEIALHQPQEIALNQPQEIAFTPSSSSSFRPAPLEAAAKQTSKSIARLRQDLVQSAAAHPTVTVGGTARHGRHEQHVKSGKKAAPPKRTQESIVVQARPRLPSKRVQAKPSMVVQATPKEFTVPTTPLRGEISFQPPPPLQEEKRPTRLQPQTTIEFRPEPLSRSSNEFRPENSEVPIPTQLPPQTTTEVAVTRLSLLAQNMGPSVEYTLDDEDILSQEEEEEEEIPTPTPLQPQTTVDVAAKRLSLLVEKMGPSVEYRHSPLLDEEDYYPKEEEDYPKEEEGPPTATEPGVTEEPWSVEDHHYVSPYAQNVDTAPGESVKVLQAKLKLGHGDDASEYEKYFRMLAVGIPLRGVKNALETEGYDRNALDEFSFVRVRPKQSIVPTRQEKEEDAIVWEGDHATYFKMLSVGVPLVAVQQRMESEGWDPNSLDLELYEKTRARARAMAEPSYEGGGRDEHLAKYFDMLKSGVIMKDVKREMEDDGLDPDALDVYQYKRIETDPLRPYFKMLAVGVPMRMVKNRMEIEGRDPFLLDDFQYQRVRPKKSIVPTKEDQVIWEGEHAIYFKMLSAGVPLVGVQQRMESEGWDPNSLDLDLYEKTRARARAMAQPSYEGGGRDEQNAKYFDMLKRGVLMKDVKWEMQRDGLDPDILDGYQYKRIEVDLPAAPLGAVAEEPEEEDLPSSAVMGSFRQETTPLSPPRIDQDDDRAKSPKLDSRDVPELDIGDFQLESNTPKIFGEEQDELDQEMSASPKVSDRFQRDVPELDIGDFQLESNTPKIFGEEHDELDQKMPASPKFSDRFQRDVPELDIGDFQLESNTPNAMDLSSQNKNFWDEHDDELDQKMPASSNFSDRFQQANDAPDPPSTPDQSDEQESWSCHVCTFLNNGALNECEMCETVRGTSSLSIPQTRLYDTLDGTEVAEGGNDVVVDGNEELGVELLRGLSIDPNRARRS